ncbi:hypothetical protein C2I33_02465 [Ralstonia solanacearum]|uniref:hypothetical protein n=1 Tax=Ralstonia solanacearum TaxID=305 RepID=UPI00018169E5|nr:hypothetical protein [Ralstonia solanacearum]MDC6178149.1 hypothetical protein [Ralstonia solanacearum]MDC6239002.1 hypothetical protein [Ralstonia solanacearum]TYZ56343.1 hypothetical protein C2I33_02465 [Ralstonia solanacearum]
MPLEPPRNWFPAKRYGWGWGLPTCWQGWAVFATYFAALGAGILLLHPGRSPAAFLAFVLLISAALTAVCWRKGEPPRWRWGDE